MDIRYLESLICVSEMGSIAKAARIQHLTAAAVGQRIAILEDYFETPLLNRHSRNAVPTHACTLLLPLAREIVSKFREMEKALDPAEISGQFRLGTIPTVLTGILPGTIRKLAKVAPKLALEIKPGTSETLYSELYDRKLDAAILALPPHQIPDRFLSTIIREEPLVLLSKKGAGQSIREKLEKNPYISFDSRSWAGNGAVNYLKDNNIDIDPFYELDALEPIEKLVAEGMGVSLVPLWPDLNLNAKQLQCEVIPGKKYARKIALISENDPTRQAVVQLLEENVGEE